MSQKNLRVIGLLVLIYSVLIIVGNIVTLVLSFLDLNKNPLMPDYLVNYIAFPSYFIIPFFGIIIYLTSKQLNKKHLNKPKIVGCFILCILYYFLWGDLHLFIHKFNPYGK